MHHPSPHPSRPETWTWREGARPLVVAHRGASALAPENTLAAFRLALEGGAAAVECDVHLSADGAPVVIHDARVDRTTSGTGQVASLTLDELRRLDAGAWFGPAFAGERVPTLGEVVGVCAGRGRLFVELKVGGGPPLVDAALQAVSAAATDVAVISFDPEIVQLVARRRPDLPLGWLLTAGHAAQLGAAGVLRAVTTAGAGVIAPHFSAATPPLIEQAHAAGLPVSVWTVDDPGTMVDLVARRRRRHHHQPARCGPAGPAR